MHIFLCVGVGCLLTDSSRSGPGGLKFEASKGSTSCDGTREGPRTGKVAGPAPRGEKRAAGDKGLQ